MAEAVGDAGAGRHSAGSGETEVGSGQWAAGCRREVLDLGRGAGKCLICPGRLSYLSRGDRGCAHAGLVSRSS
jgi:hypothetical protein